MDEGYWEGLLKMEKNKTLKPDEDLKAIALALDHANENGLAAEVVWSAMRHYQKYHSSAPETYTMEWALQCAMNDWDL